MGKHGVVELGGLYYGHVELIKVKRSNVIIHISQRIITIIVTKTVIISILIICRTRILDAYDRTILQANYINRCVLIIFTKEGGINDCFTVQGHIIDEVRNSNTNVSEELPVKHTVDNWFIIITNYSHLTRISSKAMEYRDTVHS